MNLKETVKRALMLLGVLFSGCASGSLWQHPVTHQEAMCATMGWGWYGGPAAAVKYGLCKDRLQDAGYVKVRPLNRKEISRLATPGSQRFSPPSMTNPNPNTNREIAEIDDKMARASCAAFADSQHPVTLRAAQTEEAWSAWGEAWREAYRRCMEAKGYVRQ